MARIRSVHPGLFTDEGFVSLSPYGRLLLIGLWTECDDYGTFEWKPLVLRMRIFPADSVDLAALLEELKAAGFLLRYEIEGRQLGAVKNFSRWQKPKTPSAKHPRTPEVEKWVGLKTAVSETPPKASEIKTAERRTFPQKGETSRLMEDGGDSLEEGKHPPTPQPEPALLTPQPTPPPRDDGFQAWYASYPRKTSRGAAQRAYRAALKLATAEQLLAAVQRFAELSRGKDIQFIPHPATWLNGQRWADEELAAKPEARPQLAVVGGTPPRPRLDDPESDQWRMRLKGLRERGMWMANHWGPKPGEPGCRVPPEILAEQAA